jgi:lysine 6-dehydrogenase
MRPVVVLGAGMVGSAMAIDLCDHYQVTLTDIDTKKLNGLKNHNGIHTKKADLSDKSVLKEIIKKADLVINAVPGYMGFQTLKTVIQAGKDIVDISFFSEDPFELDALAKKHKVTAIVDCGVAPGMSHMILGYHSVQMEIEYFECLVGGLPFKRIWPYFYKAPFSPIDVIEE